MGFWKILVIIGVLLFFAQPSNPDTIYFKDRTIIKNCKVVAHHELTVKVQSITHEPEEPEPTTKEMWYPKALIVKIEYENGLVDYMETNRGIYVQEFIGATAGAALGIAGGCLSSYCIAPAGLYDATFYIMAAGPLFGAAYGTAITGKRYQEKGSFWLALGGSVTLGLLPVSLAMLYDNDLPLLTLPIAIPLGAVLGYNCGK